MAARTGNIELHPPAGLRDLAFAAALRAGSSRFDKALAVALQAGITASNIQPHHAAANRRPEGHVDLVFEVGAGLGTFLCGAAAPAENSGENILETSAAGAAGFSSPAAFEHVGKVETAKIEVRSPARDRRDLRENPGPGAVRAASGPRVSLGRRGIDVVGVEPDLIVNLALLGIAQNFVGFGKRLELLFRRLVARVDVGMILAGQLAKCLANIVRRSGLLHAQDFVVVLFSGCGHSPSC